MLKFLVDFVIEVYESVDHLVVSVMMEYMGSYLMMDLLACIVGYLLPYILAVSM